MELAPLAQRSAELSRSLATLGQQCEHPDTYAGIADIANETLRLSSTLWRLREAVEVNKDKIYTEVFSQDLAEISSELQLVCDEIAECCAEMQKMDTPGPVPWFFKKGRVSKLQKHLVALKTTLVVMRTVLHHSKDYGLQTSPGCLAESSPHVIQEDRAILDSIFAKNRHAIQELYNLEQGQQSSQAHSSHSSGFELESHSRSLSNTTSPDSPSNSRDLAAATTPTLPNINTDSTALELQRRFSKRGARLSIHTSILSMHPRDTTAGLRERWLQAAKSARSSDENPFMQIPAKTARSEHVSCLEARDSFGTPSSRTTTGGGGDEEEEHGGGDDESKAKTNPDAADHDQARRKRRRATGRDRSLKRLSSPAANAVRRLIKKLSFRRPVSNTNRPVCVEDSENVTV